MKSLFFTTKQVALGVIVALIGSLFFSYSVSAQSSSSNEMPEPTREQIIEALNEALADISASVRNSTDLSTEERVGLYLSLIEVSRAILTIQTRRPGVQTEPETSRPVGSVSQEETGLYKVAAQLDINTFEADLTYYFTDDLELIEDGSVYVEYEEEESTVQLNIPAELEDMSFPEKVAHAKEQIIDRVITRTDMLRTDMNKNDVVLVSSYNPIRNVRQSRENLTTYSNNLLEDFGRYSIIEDVTVLNRGNTSYITLTSDQSERLVIALTRVLPEVRGGRGGDGQPVSQRPEDIRYIFSYAFYSTSVNQVIERERGEEPVIIPTVSSNTQNIERDEILDILVGFFGGMPFADGIEDVAEKTLDFLVNNTAYIEYNEDTTTPPSTPTLHADQCISDTDVLVMNEVLLQLIGALRTQFIVSEEAIQYHVSSRQARISGEWRCSGVQDFF